MKKISRKKFVKGLGLAGASLTLGACSVSKDEDSNAPNINTNKKYRWNMVTTWPPNFPILGEGCNMLAKWIEEMSAGQLTIKVYGGGELIPALEAFDAVSSGTAEMASGASYYWAGKTAAAQFFAAFPFGLNGQQMNAWLYAGGGMQLWDEVYAPFNVKPFAGGNTGVQMGGWFNKDINGPEDLKGLKMRMPGLGGKVLKEAGGTVVLSAGGEIYTNLERGVIDAAEWIGPYHDYTMGFHQIARNYYYPGWHEPGTTLEFMVNKRKYDNLPKHLQVIIETACARSNIWMLSTFEAKNAEYLPKITASENVKILPYPDSVLDKLRGISVNIIEELGRKDALSNKVYQSIEKFQKMSNLWSKITEKAYFDKIRKF